jgi:Tol biopolymer transport system component
MTSTSLRFKIALALLILLSGCRPKLDQQTQLSDTTNVLSFFSERRTAAGEGMGRSLILANSNGNNSAYLVGTSNIAGFYPISWSPTGNRFVAIGLDRKLERFCLILYESPNSQYCLSDSSQEGAPKWSPDGKWISFSEWVDSSSKRQLKLYNFETGKISILSNLPNGKSASVSTWSPDNKAVAYDIGLGPSDIVWMKNIAGGDAVPLFTGQFPAWSPIGKEIAFARSGKIWIYDTLSKEETMIVDDSGEAAWPTWSPDGRQLLFQSNRSGNWEVYRINRDGTGLLNISNNPAWDGLPSWRPN